MISEIANQLVLNLYSNLAFADKVAGLVKPLKKSVNKIEKVFPVAINNISDCNTSIYMDLVPNDTKASIIYCEQIGDIAFEEPRPNYWILSATLRLVCWYNLNRITEGLFIDEGIIVNNLLSKLPKRLPDSLFTYVRNVMLTPERVVLGSDIFSKYTYDEVRTQFMTFPYGAFAIDVNVQYVMNKCAETLVPEAACGIISHLKEFNPDGGVWVTPSYVHSVNGILPDGNGNVTIPIDPLYRKIYIQPNAPVNPEENSLWIQTI